MTLVTWLMQKNIYNQSSLLLFFSFLSIGVLIFFHSVFNFRLVAGLHSYCMFLPFYVIGYLSKKNEIVFWKFVDRYLILYFISFAVLAYFFVLNSCPSFVHSKSMLISFSYNSVVGLLGIFTCFSWCHRFISQDVSNVLAQVFTKLGGKTLGLYSVHLYIGLWAAHLIVPSVSNIVFYLSLLFLSCTIMSYIVVICLEKGKIVSILFLGNTKLLFNS